MQGFVSFSSKSKEPSGPVAFVLFFPSRPGPQFTGQASLQVLVEHCILYIPIILEQGNNTTKITSSATMSSFWIALVAFELLQFSKRSSQLWFIQLSSGRGSRLLLELPRACPLDDPNGTPARNWTEKAHKLRTRTPQHHLQVVYRPPVTMDSPSNNIQ